MSPCPFPTTITITPRAPRSDLVIINKKDSLPNYGFYCPANHLVKIKENENSDKYLDLATELKMLWDMKVTVIRIKIGALGIVPKGLVKGLEEFEMGG